MTDIAEGVPLKPNDTAPGDKQPGEGGPAYFLVSYLIGLGLAVLLTGIAFYLVLASPVWPPSIPIALLVLAAAQMGVHVVFFLQLTSGPDNSSNLVALAFGVLIVSLLIIGSIWIMGHLNHNMMPMPKLMEMQR
jgi:cytochrome o ubiquinol oxidase operon protein cyoD